MRQRRTQRLGEVARAGSHRLHMPWRSQGLVLEVMGNLGKGFKQRDMVRLVF